MTTGPILEPPLEPQGDILFISAPFAGLDRPSLGAHLLAAIARREGLSASVWYANLHFAAHVGEAAYETVAYSPPTDLLGERIFSPLAFPRHAFSRELYDKAEAALAAASRTDDLPPGGFASIEASARDWLTEAEALLAPLRYRVYAFTTMFAQNLATTCLARLIRRLHPDALILLGGPNCDSGMEDGMARLIPEADHIFVGEAEDTFTAFCRSLSTGTARPPRIIHGRPVARLDTAPTPEFDDYFRQLHAWLPDSRIVRGKLAMLSYETSRGCWWGQKNHCTFCGLNANGMAFRARPAAQALADLKALTERHSCTRVAMTDNIMPLEYFRDLLPELAQANLNIDIFYEQKSNLKRAQLKALHAAGVTSMQPGIEALDTALLRRMRKGVSAAQNIRLLRDCRSLGLDVLWYLLHGFPGESPADYASTERLIPLLAHLPPPLAISKVGFDRYSPYFNPPEAFGISNLRPHASYAHIYPPEHDARFLACFFEGEADIAEARDPALIARIKDGVASWIDAWRADEPPILAVARSPDGSALLVDTRNGATTEEMIPAALADAVTGESRDLTPSVRKGLDRGWIVEIDDLWLGLATVIEAG